ncbi:MAG: hypothetical protein HGB17_05315, partial [Syntrophobacteraceae bacterium]|nr:hypothetical protein [Syntrophobacteraceae bacterium]
MWRSENLPKGKPQKGDDNMLVIMGLARKAALDMRLIDSSYPDFEGSKVNAAAKSILHQYRKWDKVKGAQLVFCDLSIPANAKQKEGAKIADLIRRADEGDEAAEEELSKLSPDDIDALTAKFSVYDDLKEKLIKAGIPENEIAFIHDATTELKKEELFGKVRSGRVRVLMGSTAKMGAGMNVQERLVALHHLDAPWRPSDLEQREGRIIRQGNALYEADPEGFEVLVARYATKNTLDSRMWQTLETKARFIEQIRSGSIGDRVIEDVAGEAANSAEMKAASSGNPLILEEMTLRQKINKLGQQKSNHDREQHGIRDKIKWKEGALEVRRKSREHYQADAKASDEIGEKFSIQVSGTTYDKRSDAGNALLKKIQANSKLASFEDAVAIGKVGPFNIMIRRSNWNRVGSTEGLFDLTFSLNEEHEIHSVAISDFYNETRESENKIKLEVSDDKVAGLATRVFNAVKNQPRKDYEGILKDISEYEKDIPALKNQVGKWSGEDDLAETKKRHKAIIDELKPKEGNSPAQKTGSETESSSSISAAPAAAPFSKRSKPLSRDRVSQKGDVNPDEIVKAMEAISGTPVRYGRGWFAQHRARGWFNMKNDLIRVKVVNAMDTVAHEIGHSTHAKIVGWNVKFPAEVRKDLLKLGRALYGARQPNSGYAREGFAEFFAKKILGEDTAKSFPEIDKWFEGEVLAKHPDMAKRFKAAQEMYRQWDEQGALGRVAAMVQRVQGGPAGKVKTAYEELSKMFTRRMWVNDAAQLEKVVDQLMNETGVKLNPTENPATMRAALKMSAAGTARRFIFNHALNIKGDVVGESLADHLKPIKDRLEDFTVYAIAMRALYLHDRGINPGINLTDAEYSVAMLISPEFDKALKGVTEWSSLLIDYVVEAGGLSPDAAKVMRDLNPVYVPFKRYFDERYLGGSKGVSAKTHGIKRMKGSGRRIIDPIDMLMLQAEQMIRFGNELMVSKAIIKATEKIERTSTKSNPASVGWFANKVQAPSIGQSFSVESIRKQLEDIGANLDDADMGQLIQVFSTAYKPTGKDNIIAIWRNGKRE